MRKAIPLAILATAYQPSVYPESLSWLGVLPGGLESRALDVSADGRVVVGVAVNAQKRLRPFRWTPEKGIEDLGTPDGYDQGEAEAVSADGRLIGGRSFVIPPLSADWPLQMRATLWSEGPIDLGVLPQHSWSSAQDLALLSDGRILVVGGSGPFPFLWDSGGGMEALELPERFREGMAMGISAEGEVVAGWAVDGKGRQYALLWREGRVFELPSGAGSLALAVSGDGHVVVGFRLTPQGEKRAFRWSDAAGLEMLGTLGGESLALDLSGDGATVVGTSEVDGDERHAFRWRVGSGMEDLNRSYAHLLELGSRLEAANAISPDGRFLVGEGFNARTGRREAFLLDTAPSEFFPDGGECLPEGALVALRWNPGPGEVRIELSRDGGQTWTPLFERTANDGIEPWQVSGPLTARARLRIVRLDNGTPMGESQRPFAIVSPLTWLGTVEGARGSFATALAVRDCTVVGVSGDHAFRWRDGVGMEALGTLGGNWSRAEGIAAGGQVVGTAQDRLGRWRAVLWSGEGMLDLGTLGGESSQAYSVTPDGETAVGAAQDALGRWHAFRWTLQEGMGDLGTLGGEESVAYGVSADGGIVVGMAQDRTGKWHAFRWTLQEGMGDLGTLGGEESVAYGVSADGGIVVGTAQDRTGKWHAFRWTGEGGMKGLGAQEGSAAYAVSADGTLIAGSGRGRAFLWSEGVGLQPLDRLYSFLLEGSGLATVRAVELGGGIRIFAGWGYHAEARRFEAFRLVWPDFLVALPQDPAVGEPTLFLLNYPRSCEVDFGDGDRRFLESCLGVLQHRYRSSGTYPVRLEDGAELITEHLLIVRNGTP